MAKVNRQEQAKLNYMKNGGNLKKAMIDAGYSETYADKNSRYLMGIIGEDIRKQQEDINTAKVKSIQSIREWWSSVMDNAEEDMRERIKCSELLAKSQGAFVDKKTEADLEEQRARIDKLKAETMRIKGEDPNGEEQSDGFIEALRSEVQSAWEE